MRSEADGVMRSFNGLTSREHCKLNFGRDFVLCLNKSSNKNKSKCKSMRTLSVHIRCIYGIFQEKNKETSSLLTHTLGLDCVISRVLFWGE